MIIYKATNIENGVSYIGQTKRTLEIRKRGHEKASSNGSSTHFHNALRKYGFTSFIWEVLQNAETKEQLDELEKYYISLYRDIVGVYNICPGGTGTNLFGELNGMYGKSHTEEAKRKMSENRKGLTCDEKNGMYGKRHTEEAKLKVSIANKNKTPWNKGITKEVDERLILAAKKWQQSVKENDSIKRRREHPRFHNINEDQLIELYQNKIPMYKRAEIMGENRKLIARRLVFLREEGKIK